MVVLDCNPKLIQKDVHNKITITTAITISMETEVEYFQSVCHKYMAENIFKGSNECYKQDKLFIVLAVCVCVCEWYAHSFWYYQIDEL